MSKFRVSVWTADYDRRLTSMWEANETIATIAQSLGVSESAVKHHRANLGLKPRERYWHRSPWTKERNAELVRLWNSDLPRAEAARRMGVSCDALHYNARRLGLVAHGQRGNYKKRGASSPSILSPKRGRFDSAAALARLLERWAA